VDVVVNVLLTVQNYPDHKDNSMALFINIRFCFSLRTQVVTTFILINNGQLMAFVVFLWILLHLSGFTSCSLNSRPFFLCKPLDFRSRDWGSAPRWVAFVDFFIAAQARYAVVTGAHRRVGTTYAQLIAALAAANRHGTYGLSLNMSSHFAFSPVLNPQPKSAYPFLV